SNVISSDVNNSYDVANPLISPGETIYYDFNDVTLEQGFYFMVANLTEWDSDAQKKFMWRGHLKSSGFGGDTYYRDDTFTWSSVIPIDHTMIVDVLPIDEIGTAMVFPNLDEIVLEDNSTSVNTFTDSISSTGLHHITSDTSIEIDFTNAYTFYNDKIASSIYEAFNSTYDSYSINWNFTWNIDPVDYSPYTNLNRTQLLYTPSDWYNVPDAYYNSTPIPLKAQTSKGYLLMLGSNSDAGVIDLQTSSPNYIQVLSLSDDIGPSEEFTLGYWTNDEVNAYGHEGDTVYASINIKNLEDTGEVNFTLFDPERNVIPIKSSLDANLSYTDISSYTKAGITSSGSGLYTSDISLDPSVYGSDPVGYWTAFVKYLFNLQSSLMHLGKHSPPVISGQMMILKQFSE
ncbi:MAG: hypothetical protein ACTSQF_13225, partial [Candidatus Heimdallarchaeaceae archaeon]